MPGLNEHRKQSSSWVTRLFVVINHDDCEVADRGVSSKTRLRASATSTSGPLPGKTAHKAVKGAFERFTKFCYSGVFQPSFQARPRHNPAERRWRAAGDGEDFPRKGEGCGVISSIRQQSKKSGAACQGGAFFVSAQCQKNRPANLCA